MCGRACVRYVPTHAIIPLARARVQGKPSAISAAHHPSRACQPCSRGRVGLGGERQLVRTCRNQPRFRR